MNDKRKSIPAGHPVMYALRAGCASHKKGINRDRFLAGILAFFMAFTPVLNERAGRVLGEISACAASVTISAKSGNLLDGKPFDFFGKSRRLGLWYWQDSGGAPVFCIQPTKAMSSGTTASLDWESMEETEEVTGEQYDLLSAILQFYGCTKGHGERLTHSDYIVAQSAIWAVMSGDWQDTEYFKSEMEEIYARLNYAKKPGEKEAIIDNCRRSVDLLCREVNDYCGDDSRYIPAFASKYPENAPAYGMAETGDGGYSVTFSIDDKDKAEDIRDFVYELPAGWSYRCDGDSVTFFCDGKEAQEALITGSARPGSRLARCIPTGLIGFIRPAGEGKQEMIGELVPGKGWKCYFRLFPGGQDSPGGGSPGGGGSWYLPEVKHYRHRETFSADYTVELKKTDAETGKGLEGALFEVWEAFDKTQLEKTGLDPSQFQVWEGFMVRCPPVETDEDGHLSHGDHKTYRYEKTYCGGHPDPVIEYEEPEEGGEDAGEGEAGEEGPTREELEEEAWAAWEKEVEECGENCDFHSVDGAAVEEMLAHRDETYQEFISLEYRYAVKESRARTGYILHGLHSEDKPLKAVSLSSSQNGGRGIALPETPLLVKTAGHTGGAEEPGREGTALEESGEPEGIFAAPVITGSIGSEGLKAAGGGARTGILTGDTEGRGPGYAGKKTAARSIENWETSPAPPVTLRGGRDETGYYFEAEDHRTEGEFHISKRDMELHSQDPEHSRGKTQGDATLRGAVYGLYAAEDIVHPDGSTGVVFSAGDLVSIATTDENGDASFLCITEVSPSSEKADNLAHTWIGHPLLLGNYYVREIARSEGYELFVSGAHLPDSNRPGGESGGAVRAGSARAGNLSHRLNEWDGSWNEFEVRYYLTEQGYDIYVKGYPEGSVFYRVDYEEQREEQKVVIGSREEPRVDSAGNTVYQKALGGEYRLDRDGNRQVETDENGNIRYDESSPEPEYISEVRGRRGNRPVLTASPSNASRWKEEADPDFVLEEAEAILEEAGYSLIGGERAGEVPWARIRLSGHTNGEWLRSILNYFRGRPFWDCGSVHEIYEEKGEWYALLFYDYSRYPDGAGGVRDPKDGAVYVRKSVSVQDGGEEYQSWYYVRYGPGDYTARKNGIYAARKREAPETADYALDLEAQIKPVYYPKYAAYAPGELLLDREGNPIPETDIVYEYGTQEQSVRTEKLIPLTGALYDRDTKTYKIHIDNGEDWTKGAGEATALFRAQAPFTEITHGGERMAYADYLLRVAGAGVTALSSGRPESGSFIERAPLIYPGQTWVFQDCGARARPAVVMERVIKQAVKVEKHIAEDSYKEVNTYKIHRDPFTVLFGGYRGKPAGSLPGFRFRIYLKSSLEATGKLRTLPGGGYDYQEFFEKEPELAERLAVKWDIPKYDEDGDMTTVHAGRGGGTSLYYGVSAMLPYGTYVVEEQQPRREAANRHYRIAPPREVVIPFVPEQRADGTVDQNRPGREYLYDASMTPEALVQKYKIRFNPEDHVITAHNHSGDHPVYKYGKKEEEEQAGERDGVYYDVYINSEGREEGYGVTRDHVPTMTGVTTAVDRVYAPALVPWSVLPPEAGENARRPEGGSGRDSGEFSFVSWAECSFENTFYSSKLRIEKIDGETGENLIHDGAYFRIYAAKRDIIGVGTGQIAGTGSVIWNPDGTPAYDEDEQIFMTDKTGAQVGEFRAYSTIRDMSDGSAVRQIPVGYIETYQPLGAGVYVLVETAAPPGYVKSRPVAFEVYSDKVVYYQQGNPLKPVEAEKYRYGSGDSQTEVNRIWVENMPVRAEIHKVEGGERTLRYRVKGSLKQLLARGDTAPVYDGSGKFTGYGSAVKTWERYSAERVYGAEEEILEDKGVNPVYRPDGTFAGFGLRYDIYVGGAGLTLYRGLEIEKTEGGDWKKISVKRDEGGRVTGIFAEESGRRPSVEPVIPGDKDTVNPVWDFTYTKNPPASLWFYDLKSSLVEKDTETGQLYGLDERGNRICLVDAETGMAYVRGREGRYAAYLADERGLKIPVQSIEVFAGEDGKEFIYRAKAPVPDENDLPLYDEAGHVVWREESFTTAGEPAGHLIKRIPAGAYVLEEVSPPYEQGYIKSQAEGIFVSETADVQTWYMEDDFTKAEFAKVDISSGEEIKNAHMTLYRAVRVEDPFDEKGYYLEAARDGDGTPEIYAEWISGYQYDGRGILKTDESGRPLATKRPRWLDHIPVGDYLLEETRVPLEDGYVGCRPLEITVAETGKVQNWVMEDDYTQAEFLKRDSETGLPVKNAGLGLYLPVTDENGVPRLDEDGEPLRGDEIAGWNTGKALGETPVLSMSKAKYTVSEDGTAHFDYLPPGYYVLAEKEAPPGYASASAQLIHIRELGGRTQLQQFVMEDKALEAVFAKVDGRREMIAGACLSLYRKNEDGSRGELAARWTTETVPRRLTYLPKGEYILKEERTPKGYLTAKDLEIEIKDTPEVHMVYMEDGMAEGVLELLKTDDESGRPLAGARFEVRNRTLDLAAGTVETGQDGRASLAGLQIGYTDREGLWSPYIYSVREVKAPVGYELNPQAHEFRFEYRGPDEALSVYTCRITDKPEQEVVPRGNPSPGGPEKIVEEPEEPISGRVTAYYPIRVKAAEKRSRGRGLGWIPKLGDSAPAVLFWLCMAASAAVCAWVLKKKKLFFWLLLAAGLTAVWGPEETFAQAGTPSGRVTVTSGFLGKEEKDYKPEPEYTDEEGKRYRLESWELEPAVLEESVQEVESQVFYPETEGKEQLPPKCTIEAEDERTGRRASAEFPILSVEAQREQWSDGFQVPLVFHSYGADSYQIGEGFISCSGEVLEPAGHEQEILALIEADPGDYEILSLAWDGEPYPDESGVLCRNAVASGRKRLVDYVATYGGSMTFPAEEGYRCTAVYRLPEPVPAAGQARPAQTNPAAEPLPKIREAAPQQAPFPYLQAIREALIITVAVSGAALLAAVLIWLLYRLRKRVKAARDRINV